MHELSITQSILDISLKAAKEQHATRIRAIRLDQAPDLKFEVPRATQYALRVRSSVPVSVQYGRMDVRQPNLAYYCTMAFPAD